VKIDALDSFRLMLTCSSHSSGMCSRR